MSRRAWMDECERYLAARTGRYEWRRARYQRAAERLLAGGLSDHDTLVDVGAGWTELDYYLRRELAWRGRYIPLDGAIDGVDATPRGSSGRCGRRPPRAWC